MKFHKFPCGFYCKEHVYEANMSSLPKDCGTCYHLRFAECSKGLTPKLKSSSAKLLRPHESGALRTKKECEK